jgi:hypothetical protein
MMRTPYQTKAPLLQEVSARPRARQYATWQARHMVRENRHPRIKRR